MSLQRDAGPVNIYFFAILMSCEIAGADAHVGIVNAVVHEDETGSIRRDAQQRPTQLEPNYAVLFRTRSTFGARIVIFSRHPISSSIGCMAGMRAKIRRRAMAVSVRARGAPRQK